MYLDPVCINYGVSYFSDVNFFFFFLFYTSSDINIIATADVIVLIADFILICLLPMQLSFPVVSSLNTVHLFASNLKSSLLSCSTSGAQVVWKTFHNRSVLV